MKAWGKAKGSQRGLLKREIRARQLGIKIPDEGVVGGEGWGKLKRLRGVQARAVRKVKRSIEGRSVKKKSNLGERK